MRLRLLFTLSLFIAAVAIIWSYTYVDNDIGGKQRSTWEQTIADLKVCSDIKNSKERAYEAFAAAASNEQRPREARLFAALAYSELIHAHNCAEALQRLGGTYAPDPDKRSVETGAADDNLDRSIGIEKNIRNTYDSGMIDRALDSRNRYAARIMTWLAAGDLKHLALLEQCREQHDRHEGGDRYAVCPKCGNIYSYDAIDIYCPFCITKSAEFVLFE